MLLTYLYIWEGYKTFGNIIMMEKQKYILFRELKEGLNHDGLLVFLDALDFSSLYV